MNRGTPKNLDESLAVIIGLTPAADLRNYPYFVMKDFLSQKFGTYMLKYSDNEVLVKVLQELFDDIVRRPHKET